ncbi:Hypothetical_protein [Hexamita inflata]|uniref:Hypothetical_protein n=1 Tax=Hexamita inflata TaxID=28002 RepID=A0ABP1HDH8_9EUKA
MDPSQNQKPKQMTMAQQLQYQQIMLQKQKQLLAQKQEMQARQHAKLQAQAKSGQPTAQIPPQANQTQQQPQIQQSKVVQSVQNQVNQQNQQIQPQIQPQVNNQQKVTQVTQIQQQKPVQNQINQNLNQQVQPTTNNQQNIAQIQPNILQQAQPKIQTPPIQPVPQKTVQNEPVKVQVQKQIPQKELQAPQIPKPFPVKADPLTTRKQSQMYFTKLALTMFNQPIQCAQHQITLNFPFNFNQEQELGTISIPENAALNVKVSVFKKYSISFGSILSATYGVDLTKEFHLLDKVTIFLHQNLLKYKQNQAHVESNTTLDFQNQNQCARFFATGLSFLLRLYRATHKSQFVSTYEANNLVLKQNFYQMCALQFKDDYEQIKLQIDDADNSKMEELCDFMANICKVVDKAELESETAENTDIQFQIENENLFNPVLSKSTVLFEFENLKGFLKDLLQLQSLIAEEEHFDELEELRREIESEQNPHKIKSKQTANKPLNTVEYQEPDIKTSQEMIQNALTYVECIKFKDNDKEQLQMILDMLAQVLDMPIDDTMDITNGKKQNAKETANNKNKQLIQYLQDFVGDLLQPADQDDINMNMLLNDENDDEINMLGEINNQDIEDELKQMEDDLI